MIEETNQNTFQHFYSDEINKLPNELTQNLLLGSLLCLDDKDNPARLHFFAYGIRELLNALLKYYAPDSEVLNSHWYEKPENNKKITRAQRVQYAIMGGISEEYIANIVGHDFFEISKEILDKIQSANDLVHFKDEELVSEPTQVESVAEEFLVILFYFLDTIKETKKTVSKKIEIHVYDRLKEAFPDKIHNNGYHAVTRYVLPVWGDIEDENCEVIGIDSKEVSIRFTADVEIELQTSSTDDYHEQRSLFPVVLEYTASVDDLSNLTLKNSEIDESAPIWTESEDERYELEMSYEINRLVSRDSL